MQDKKGQNNIQSGVNRFANHSENLQSTIKAISKKADSNIIAGFSEDVDHFLYQTEFYAASKALSTMFHEWTRANLDNGDSQSCKQMSFDIQCLQELLMDLQETQRFHLWIMQRDINKAIEDQTTVQPIAC